MASLKQVVVSSDQVHTQIYEKEAHDFEVLADIPTYLKLKIKDKLPPCTITVASVDQSKCYFTIYVSDEVRTPNEQ